MSTGRIKGKGESREGMRRSRWKWQQQNKGSKGRHRTRRREIKDVEAKERGSDSKPVKYEPWDGPGESNSPRQTLDCLRSKQGHFLHNFLPWFLHLYLSKRKVSFLLLTKIPATPSVDHMSCTLPACCTSLLSRDSSIINTLSAILNQTNIPWQTISCLKQCHSQTHFSLLTSTMELGRAKYFFSQPLLLVGVACNSCGPWGESRSPRGFWKNWFW